MRLSGCFFTVCFILLILAVFCGKQAGQEFNTQEIVGKWVTFWNTYDLNMVDSLFITDNRLTYFSSEKEGIIRGIDAVREHHKGFGFVSGGKHTLNKLWLDSLQTDVFNSVAVVTGIWYFQKGASDTTTIQRGPVTAVYVKDGKEFKIAHMNFSSYK
jgi:hypothetical protein